MDEANVVQTDLKSSKVEIKEIFTISRIVRQQIALRLDPNCGRNGLKSNPGYFYK